MASTSINVNLITDQGTTVLVAKVDRNRLIHFSDLAAAQLANGGPHDTRLPKDAVTLARGQADGKAAARITTWIETNSIKEPEQLTVAGMINLHMTNVC